jgi:hypothetical protein
MGFYEVRKCLKKSGLPHKRTPPLTDRAMTHPAKLRLSQPEPHFTCFGVWYLTETQNAGTSAYTLGQPFKLGQFGIDRLNIRSPCPVVIPRAIPL